MKKICLLFPLAMLAACEAEQAPAPVENVVEAPAEIPDVALAGEWTVDAYRNNSLPATAAMNASFGQSELVITSPCARMTWSYEVKGNIVSFEPGGGRGGCAARGDSFENAVANAVDQATIAMEMNGGVQLSGAGGAIDLMPR